MSMKFTELQCKEVICVGSGQRLGFISDVLVELPEGQVRAVVVPCPCRFPAGLGRREDFLIPWSCIEKIGPDIVLVNTRPEECRTPRAGKLRPF